MHADLLIVHAGQLVTCASQGAPKRGQSLRDLGIIPDGAIAIQGERIIGLGPTETLEPLYHADQVIDAEGCVVCPGFVDPHTHLVYGGDRLDEFELKLSGASYLDILAAGGGIMHTTHATRESPFESLLHSAQARLKTMQRLGTTTVEIKSGYGLELDAELKILQVIEALRDDYEVIPTFMGAHAIPSEYREQPEGYLRLLLDEMLPMVANWYDGSSFKRDQIPFFVDVFCEQHAFDLNQSRQILERSQDYGMIAKLHVDEFHHLGGVSLAIEIGAQSVDHLDVTPPSDIHALAQSNTAAVIMPVVNLHLGNTHFANVREMIDQGAIVALATDLNPGSAPCFSMPLVMAIASRYGRMLPSEALNASTINAAYAIGMHDRLGSLEVGKQADLLILKTNDYRDLIYLLGENLVSQVIKKGKSC
ncbi:MAG: imidazolonepropionase [Anaerolineae bacterium]|jgi:imidazolonepropionase|nr:imidazolonepropionase [Anaerolineae bacterium]